MFRLTTPLMTQFWCPGNSSPRPICHSAVVPAEETFRRTRVFEMRDATLDHADWLDARLVK